MNKKILIIFIVFFLTGCWNYQELNSLAITTALAIDKTKDGYEVSVLIANSKKEQSITSNTGSQTILYSGKGNTVLEALKAINSLSSRKIYIGHVSVIIISEEIARDDLINSLDFFARSAESTKRFQLAIAKNTKAKNILKIITPLETFPAQSISNNIRVSEETQAKSSPMLYSNFIYILLEKGYNPVLPSIKINGDVEDGSKNKSLQQTSPDAIVKLDTMALFKDTKLIDYANEAESKGINIIRNQVNQMNIYLKNNENYISLKISNIKSKIKLLDSNSLKYNVNVKAIATIIEDNFSHDLLNNKIIEKIEKDAEKELKKLMEKGLLKAKNLKTDIFGFGNILYKNNPDLFNNNWDNDGFIKADINFKVNVQLKFTGAAKQNLKEALNENQNK